MDAQEMRFDFTRPVRFVDLEGGADLVADPSVMHATYLQGLEQHLATLKDGCRKFHVDYRRAVVDAEFEKVLTRFLLEHEQLATGGQGGHRS
jgi:hypothetical protein